MKAVAGAACLLGLVVVLMALSRSHPVGNPQARSADAARGKSLFERRCTGCHALDADREGPHLRGVYGRRAGSVPGFAYSEALKKSGLTWDEHSLDRWLSDTDAAVPGSAMDFSVPKRQDRADIVAFLKSTR